MAQPTKLAPMMQLFALEYIIDFNGKEAAIRAGYKPNYAGQQAHRLLNDERVLSAITDAIAERKKRLFITQDQVVTMWWQIANADYNELSSVRRVACDMCHFTVDHDGSEPVDKTINPDCRNCQGEGVPYVHIADTDKLSPTAKLLYQGAKETKFGIEVMTADRMKALDNVARHLGMFNEQKDEDDSVPTPVSINIEVKDGRKPESNDTSS